jgi:hypothetical protein
MSTSATTPSIAAVERDADRQRHRDHDDRLQHDLHEVLADTAEDQRQALHRRDEQPVGDAAVEVLDRRHRRVLVELTPLARERVEVIWGPYSFFQEMLGRYTIEQLELLRDFHRAGREFNERRAVEVRAMRIGDQSAREK